jgi:pyrimidine-nucleoside phosphorylase
MNVAQLIQKKRDNQALKSEEIRFLVDGFTAGRIPDYQMAAFAMAVFCRGMNFEETTALTRTMMESGRVLEWPRGGTPKTFGVEHSLKGRRDARPTIKEFYCDKHSTGGIGDKISLILAPLVAACGVKVPMISGRGLGHTGGTLDKMESIPGFRTNLSVEEFQRIVAEVGCAVVGQTIEICPADKKLYALRDVTATVPSLPLIVSSIMSKKLAEGLDGLVLDVKWGSGAFMKNMPDAEALAEAMVAVAKLMGKKCSALITDMNQPLGRTAGNALEVEEVIAILNGECVADVLEVTMALGSEMLMMAGVAANGEAARAMLGEKLLSGAALKKFAAMVEAQGGNPAVADSPSVLPRARRKEHIHAPKSGVVQAVDTERLGWAAIALGAGRKVATDTVDASVGLSGIKKIGERVERRKPLLTLHYNNDRALAEAAHLAESAFLIGEEPVPMMPLVVEKID